MDETDEIVEEMLTTEERKAIEAIVRPKEGMCATPGCINKARGISAPYCPSCKKNMQRGSIGREQCTSCGAIIPDEDVIRRPGMPPRTRHVCSGKLM